MDNIDSPMAIIESQNKKEPYTIIVLTDIVDTDTQGNDALIGYFLRPTKDGSIIVSSYRLYKQDIEKNIAGLKAIDRKKAEDLFGVSGSLKNLTIPILNNSSAADSIADLKEKYKNYYYKQGDENPRGSITSFDRQYWIDLFSGSDKSTLLHEGSHGWLSEVLYFASVWIVKFV